MFNEYEELVQLAQLALSGKTQDAQLFVSRLARRLRKVEPGVADQLDALLAKLPTRGSGLRSDSATAVPVDLDSRLQLARPEYPVELSADPLWAAAVEQRLNQVVAERRREKALAKAGLLPTKTMLFTGEPGVGKSLAARWMANQLDRPLLTLDLSAVMSSYLGRTGANVRQVLDYAKTLDCVLFLDELDAVAKRRDDDAEIGELKRLVTVLLQEIDGWPSTGLLLAATNHPDLLDPAVWRRFDVIVEFPMPSQEQIRQLVERLLGAHELEAEFLTFVSAAFSARSFSDIERDILRAKRESVVSQRSITDVLPMVARESIDMLPRAKKKLLAVTLRKTFRLTERDVREWTGISRDTLRAATKKAT